MAPWSRHSIAVIVLAGGLTAVSVGACFSATGLELVTRANQAFEDGKYPEAQAAIEEALKATQDKDLTARAMLLRAQVNEKTGRLARALSDYSGALWMNALPASEKKKATDGKERVMAAMGLNSAGQSTASGQGGAQTAAATGGSSGSGSSGGLFGMFGGLFGGEQKPAQTATPTPQTAEPAWKTATAPAGVKAEKPSPAKKAAKAATAEDEEEAPKPKPAKKDKAKEKEKPQKVASAEPVEKPVRGRVEKASAVVADTAASEGGIFIDLGGASSSAAAKEQAKTIKSKVSDILVHRELIVRQGGSGYRIVAGPYKVKTAANALCSAMIKRGVTCQVSSE